MIERIVAVVAVVVGAIAGGWLLLGYVDESAYQRGVIAGKLECQRVDLERLRGVLQHTDALAQAAASASERLSRSVAARVKQDATARQEMLDVLEKTAPARAHCVFDAVLMQHLAAARDRAAQAVTGGIDDPVPAPRGDDGGQR